MMPADMTLTLAETLDTGIALFGRIHPLVLHLPIGLVGALVVMEAWRTLRGERELPSATLPIAWLNAATGVAAFLSGLALATEPGYSGTTLDRHRVLGIVVGVVCVIVAACVTIAARRPGRGGPVAALRVSLAAAALLLVPVGHLGATMTHGEDFLTAPLHERIAPASTTAAPKDDVPPAVRAILDSKCVACHGTKRTKGLLDLHTLAAIEAGGEEGPVVAWGSPDESRLLQRVLLPIDDEDHMPPEGKPQPSAADIETLRAWLAAPHGAEAHRESTALVTEDPPAAGPSAAAAPPPPPPAPVADPKAIAALRDRLVHVQPVSAESPLLWIDFAATQRIDDASVRALLEPLRDLIGELSLARSGITDATLELIASMPALRTLDLRDTAITDEGLAKLASHAALEELVLVGTKVSERSLATVRSLPKLTRLYVWNTSIPRDPLVALRAERPTLLADADDELATALEVEPALTFTSDAPQPAAPGAAPGAAPTAVAPIVPVNAVCPVSGAAVNPARVIVWEGRAIGFCCEKCAAQFWADPAKFVGNVKPK